MFAELPERRERAMKKLILIVAALWILVGCNTVSGIGKDIQKAGETIEDATKKK
jgi:predicted small secreted protein